MSMGGSIAVSLLGSGPEPFSKIKKATEMRLFCKKKRDLKVPFSTTFLKRYLEGVVHLNGEDFVVSDTAEVILVPIVITVQDLHVGAAAEVVLVA